ncbi:MAG: DNA mismatch endonuclease Vsr [Smithella sp.]|jgi:DNA mismatch endonuclease (patch repair protein)
MRKIGPKNSKPEIIIRKLIHNMGYRYRLHRKDLPGKPDLVFPKYKKVIFVHGCFWHGHEGCKRATIPETNEHFWKKKIARNIDNDFRKCKGLNELGWNHLVIWQCEIKSKNVEIIKRIVSDFLKEDKGTTGTNCN